MRCGGPVVKLKCPLYQAIASSPFLLPLLVPPYLPKKMTISGIDYCVRLSRITSPRSQAVWKGRVS